MKSRWTTPRFAASTLGSPYYSYRKALPDEHKWQVGDTAAWQKGNHSIKFGVDMVHNYDIMNNTYEGNGIYTYSYIGNYFADLLNEANSYGSSPHGVCNSTSTVTAPGSQRRTTPEPLPAEPFIRASGRRPGISPP